jgi:SAM-dependent methyltransferase
MSVRLEPASSTRRWRPWDCRYVSAEGTVPRQPDGALIEFVYGLPARRAVDLGAGEGRNSLWLARQGWQVTAVDLSISGLQGLTEHAAAEGLTVNTVVAEMNDYLACGERFDLVVLANIHPPLEQRIRLHAAAARAVAPGGHLYFIGHCFDCVSQAGPPDPLRLRAEDSLVFPGLQVLRTQRRERARPPGVAALVDVVAWAVRPQTGLATAGVQLANPDRMVEVNP